MKSQTIIVIGAGAAGLAAARDLSLAGREVIVLEARDRIGGRVFTHTDPRQSVPIEYGAEFIHGKSPELWRLARAAHLETYEVSKRHWYFEDGELSKSHEFWKTIESLLDQMKSSPVDRSLKEFLDQLPDDEETSRAKAMLTRYVEGFHAAAIARIGTRGLVVATEAADSIDGDRAFRFLAGYASLMEALRAEAETYGADFRLHTVVKEIHWQGGQVEVSGSARVPRASSTTGASDVEEAASQRFHADAVIVTLPLSILQKLPDNGGIRFVPELPGPKQSAIHTLVMGNVIKINLLFRERFWENVKRWDHEGSEAGFREAGFFHFPGLPFPTWWTQLPIRAPLLVGWVGGAQASDLSSRSGRLTIAQHFSAGIDVTDDIQAREAGDRDHGTSRIVGEDLLLDRAIASLSRIFNFPAADIHEQLDRCYLHDWRADPFTGGAYAYLPVKGVEAQRVFSEPIDSKLFFAGEATSVGHIGTVHGAIQSGQRAARELLS